MRHYVMLGEKAYKVTWGTVPQVTSRA